jgi:hypothetical protein
LQLNIWIEKKRDGDKSHGHDYYVEWIERVSVEPFQMLETT